MAVEQLRYRAELLEKELREQKESNHSLQLKQAFAHGSSQHRGGV